MRMRIVATRITLMLSRGDSQLRTCSHSDGSSVGPLLLVEIPIVSISVQNIRVVPESQEDLRPGGHTHLPCCSKVPPDFRQACSTGLSRIQKTFYKMGIEVDSVVAELKERYHDTESE